VDIPRIFNIMESAHRIHNPITAEKLATLGAALGEIGDAPHFKRKSGTHPILR
jgi:hypothetical protein